MNSGKFIAKAQRREDSLQYLWFVAENTCHIHFGCENPVVGVFHRPLTRIIKSIDKSEMKKRIAIIDLGTNTFHLLIAERAGNKATILYSEKQAVKIGLGSINHGIITDEGVLRALNCIKNFKVAMQEWNVIQVQALGTSALRNAVNGKNVIQKIKSETGIEIKIISGHVEAEYIYFGVRSALDLGTEKSLIVDIGGGSVEFIIGDRENIFWKQSYEIGAQRLLEMCHKHDPFLLEEANQLEAHLNKTLMSLKDANQKFKPLTLVGSSGTFDTLSEIYCIHHQIDISFHPPETPLTIPDFYEIHKELLSKNRAQRLKIPGMIEMRVDMIVVASCLVKYLLDNFSFQKIRVSSYSLKEGVLAKWAEGF